MVYAIIALIVLVALAPLWHFMPTKRQKHQARLRETAALAGLFVEFRDLPLGPERSARLPASERQVLYYGLRLPASRKKPRIRQAWYRDNAQWRSPAGRADPPGFSEELPASVLAIAVSEESCGIFWQERGDEDTVREIAALLEDWKGNLLSS
ncbi:hypothetical protein [Congregibacter litoralis]|uniref:Uncharacterized protein n=1 Tax=Congregibacter litoralis KT71 TaxID=314285 RepID=A4A880_9GAMM|nr:hypothetical protein [Congregibacter litoralis]EAQ97875.1 hypothetical protein KT71_14959 [Congregibacter litoralis KT71]